MINFSQSSTSAAFAPIIKKSIVIFFNGKIIPKRTGCPTPPAVRHHMPRCSSRILLPIRIKITPPASSALLL